MALALNETAVRVARDLGTTPILPGNVYNYGRDMPPVITDATPERPSTRKGEIRRAMEARMRAGCARSIIGDIPAMPLADAMRSTLAAMLSLARQA